MTFSLNKSRKILKSSYDCYKKRGRELSDPELARVEENLQALDNAIQENDKVLADQHARYLTDNFTSVHCKSSTGSYLKELVIAIVIALLIATVVRQMWFELYEIPTGSMRPTFKEKDHLIVSKTTFGINFPLRTEHLYFDPTLVQRNGVVVFSGDGIDLPDTNTTFLGIFPYKKRYIKRLIGKPGDTLYFYGGKIYGFDCDGNDLVDLNDNASLEKIDHVPYMGFEGRLSGGNRNSQKSNSNPNVTDIFFLQMNLPIGRMAIQRQGESEGEIFNGTEWIKDQPLASKKPHNSLQTYSDFWGFHNYAMARLLTREQVEKYSGVNTKNLEQGVLYLELRHNVSLNYPKPRFFHDEQGNTIFLLTPYVTVIPLQQKHLDAIMKNMYTARFVVEAEKAKRYSGEGGNPGIGPRLPGVPDGTYEFYYGDAYQIGFGGTSSLLSADHPLYKTDPQNIQRLFNLGIDFRNIYEPHSANQAYFPARYAYFREGDLYVMGGSILKKTDPTLIQFNEQEKKHEEESSASAPYIAFKDYGAPLKDGKIDQEFIRAFGIQIPDKHYLVLGDNYAMSSDSRYFGFIPENNLQGAPSFILWPLGHRWGLPNQVDYPWINVASSIIWGVVLLVLGTWFIIYKINQKKRVFKKINFS